LVFKNKEREVLRKALYALQSVKYSIRRLEVLMDTITTRRTKLLNIAAQLEARGETYLAKRYASEVAKLDALYSRLASIKLVLEKIASVIEYAITMNSFRGLVGGITDLVKDLKKLPEASIPDIGLMLADIEHAVRELEDAQMAPADTMDISMPLEPDVERILEEARAILKSKLESELSPSTR